MHINNDISTIIPFGAWAGKRCLLIGGGPSLSNFDPNLISNEFTIGINKAFVKFSCTINYGMDYRFYEQLTHVDGKDKEKLSLHEQWVNYKGIKVFLKMDNNSKFDGGVYTIKKLSQKVLRFDLSEGIYPGGNSGFGALMLAVALGATKIGLLGYDFKVDKDCNRTHWHQGYGQKIDHMERVLRNFKAGFEAIAPKIEEHKILVFNLNPNSNLKCFPFAGIEEFLK